MGKPIGSGLEVRHLSSPTSPAAGHALLYPKSDGKWYTKDPAGVEAELGSGGGGGTGVTVGNTAPTSPVDGQLWYHTAQAALKTWVASVAEWRRTFADIQVSTTPPPNTWVGIQWLDTSTTPAVLKAYDGTNWVAPGAVISTTAPANPTNGQIWHDPTGLMPEQVAPVPVGSLMPYAGDAAPTGYLVADGGTFSSVTYPQLAVVVGDKYGPHSGTTYYLPDLRSRIPVGMSADVEFDAVGKTGGAKTHQLTEAEMPSHYHTTTTWGHPQPISATGGAFIRHTATDSIITYTINTNSKGGDAAHNNLQPYITLNYIIKAG